MALWTAAREEEGEKFKVVGVSGFGDNQYTAVAFTSVVLTSDAATSWGVFFNHTHPSFPLHTDIIVCLLFVRVCTTIPLCCFINHCAVLCWIV